MLSVLITGCPRSGTRYAAETFTRSGVFLGHEVEGRDGTVDWRLAGRRTKHELVLHQVRHPLDTIASMATIQWAGSWAYFEELLPFPSDDLASRCQAWLLWTAIAERAAEFTYRVEDIDSAWPRLQQCIPGLHEFTDSISRKTNSRGHDPVTWQDVDEAGYGYALRDRAERYGYDT